MVVVALVRVVIGMVFDNVPIVGVQIIQWSIVMIFMVFLRLIRLLFLSVEQFTQFSADSKVTISAEEYQQY